MTEPIDIAARRKLLQMIVGNRPELSEGDFLPLRFDTATRRIIAADRQVLAAVHLLGDGELIVAAVNDYATLLEALAEIRREVELPFPGTLSKSYAARISAIDAILRRTVR